MIQHFGRRLTVGVVDEARPIIAWRTWLLPRRTPTLMQPWRGLRRLRLTSTARDVRWPARHPLISTCLAYEDAYREVWRCNVGMRPDCTCGVWGTKTLEDLVAHGTVGLWPTAVVGQVALWGAVIVYEHGFRAAAARPVRVWFGNAEGASVARRLARIYGIPVATDLPTEVLTPLETWRGLSVAIDHHGDSASPEPVSGDAPPRRDP